MSQKVKLSNDTIIEISNSPFASGGEADVYEILSPSNYTKQVLKIYKTDKRTKLKEDKIKFLVNNKPSLIPSNDHHSVIWPIHLAYRSNEFVGYTMPKASGIKLELLCHPKLPKSLSKEWDKFSFNSPGAIEARLKLCFNISAALSLIHSFGSYVLVDMKPDNVMVKPDGLIAIIDIDSTEIIRSNTLLFPAHVATPEYTPPEYYKTIGNIEKNVINETWDRFSIAIIFYRLLFGIHPFTASLKSPFEDLTNISDIILKGFLPVGKFKEKFKIIPPPHSNFNKLGKQIQQLFLNALEGSIDNPNIRPSADDWCRILSPNPGIQVNRQLPTKIYHCLLPVYSEAIQLRNIPTVKIEIPIYLNIKYTDGIIAKLIRLVKKSEKEKLYELILDAQNKVNIEYEKLENLKKQYQRERERNKEDIYVVLKDEKSNIDKILSSYLLKSKKIDKQAEDLFQKETEEYISFEKTYRNEFNSIEFKIKEEYELIVNSFEYNNEKEKERLLLDLNTVNNRESEQIALLDIKLKSSLDDIKTKIQKLEKEYSDKIDNESKSIIRAIEEKRNLLKIKEKKLLIEALEKYQSTFTNNSLSQFKILDEKYSIFTDMYADPDRIATNLSRNGIVTAADIKGVDESGRILKSNGSWVKVPDVAYTRARKLDDWRRRKDRTSTSATPPQSLPYSEELKVKNMMLPEFNLIDEEEKVVKQKILQSKNTLPSQLSSHLAEAKKQEVKITNDIQAQKLNVSKSSKSERDQLQAKINEFIKNYNRLKINQQQIFENKTKQIKEKLEVLKKSKELFYANTKNTYDALHQEFIKDLRILDKQFSSDSTGIRETSMDNMIEIKNRCDLAFDNITNRIKDNINLFNDLVNLLISKQAKYGQMK